MSNAACLVARLRAEVAWEADVGELMAEAASEIERLRGQRNQWMEAALAHEQIAAELRVRLMEMPERDGFANTPDLTPSGTDCTASVKK
jgi:hypothetical protein